MAKAISMVVAYFTNVTEAEMSALSKRAMVAVELAPHQGKMKPTGKPGAHGFRADGVKSADGKFWCNANCYEVDGVKSAAAEVTALPTAPTAPAESAALAAMFGGIAETLTALTKEVAALKKSAKK